MKTKFIFLFLFLIQTSIFSQTLIKFRNGYLWGYQDAITKRTLIPAKFGYAEDFKGGLAVVAEGASSPGQAQQLRIINIKGAYITDSVVYGSIINLGSGLVAVTSPASEYGHSNGIVVFGNNIFGIIDKTGKTILPIEYSKINDISEGLIVVVKENQFGIIDLTGRFIVPLQSDFTIFNFKYGVAKIRRNAADGFQDGLMDKTGKIMLDPGTSKLTIESDFNKFYIAEIRKNNLYGLINSSGKIIVEPIYSRSSGFTDRGVTYYKDNEHIGVKFDGSGKKY